WSETGSEREKWHPTTRETADHSMPFIVAAILIDGRFNEDIFDERLHDPRIHSLTDKITVKEDAELSRQFPNTMPCRIEVEAKDGRRGVSSVAYPHGHVKNPMSDEEVNEKFRELAQRVLSRERADAALDLLWKLERARDLDSVYAAMRVDGAQ